MWGFFFWGGGEGFVFCCFLNWYQWFKLKMLRLYSRYMTFTNIVGSKSSKCCFSASSSLYIYYTIMIIGQLKIDIFQTSSFNTPIVFLSNNKKERDRYTLGVPLLERPNAIYP